MAVRLFLSSGTERVLETADAARLDEPFFIITRWHPEIRQLETVLTLRAEDVVAAEVLKNGVRVDYVVGRGPPPR
jgi:hypothetical protein